MFFISIICFFTNIVFCTDFGCETKRLVGDDDDRSYEENFGRVKKSTSSVIKNVAKFAKNLFTTKIGYTKLNIEEKRTKKINNSQNEPCNEFTYINEQSDKIITLLLEPKDQEDPKTMQNTKQQADNDFIVIYTRKKLEFLLIDKHNNKLQYKKRTKILNHIPNTNKYNAEIDYEAKKETKLSNNIEILASIQITNCEICSEIRTEIYRSKSNRNNILADGQQNETKQTCDISKQDSASNEKLKEEPKKIIKELDFLLKQKINDQTGSIFLYKLNTRDESIKCFHGIDCQLIITPTQNSNED